MPRTALKRTAAKRTVKKGGDALPNTAQAIRGTAKAQKSKARGIQRDLEDASALQRLRRIRVPDAAGNMREVSTPGIYEGPPTMEDQVYATKRAMVQPNGIVPGYGYAEFTEKDAEKIIKDQLIRRTWEEEAAIISMFNPDDPAHAEILHRIIPDFYINRELVIDIISQMQNSAAKINLHGIRTDKDARFMARMKMLNVPKDEKGWPKVLAKGVHLMNYGDAKDLGLDSDPRLKGVDLSQLFSKAAPDGIKRTMWGWSFGDNTELNDLPHYGKPYMGEGGGQPNRGGDWVTADITQNNFV
jgi:hypothetical protein